MGRWAVSQKPKLIQIFCVAFYRRIISTPFLDLQHWHHVCITWTNSGGLVKGFIDGLLKRELPGLGDSYIIKGGGALVFGQDQDAIGGAFEAKQSFAGLMSHVNMWSYVLPPFSLVDMAMGFGTEKGNLVAWSEIVKAQLHGEVGLIPAEENPPKRKIIGHFRVPKPLTFKMRLGAQPFL